MQNNQTVLTEEQKKDFQERANNAQNDIKALMEKYEISMIATPVMSYTPMGALINANIGFQDTKFTPKTETNTVEEKKENA